ncbi:hypothetical protein jaqu_06540 [Jannaschia aquimarina]|uniref:Lipoprotein n=2 Tax=Jannaschia aquimarina TaxID=935700 RepID=A0A0D1EKC2_9RHOB|nr:hypothetical protein jaqu_06540 [Jannaschia aquimarina]SNS75356.1 hypothetical protein SAMN05421775_102156 [Jannaschia aquimarina]
MRGLVFLAFAGLAACGSPHPLDGLDRTGTARVEGRDYRVNWNVSTAQVTRMTPEWRPAFASVARGAAIAAEQVTGCKVVPSSVSGDIAMLNMALDCTAS